MVGCSAPNCSNRAAKGGYKMKRFPADPAIRQIWINNVRRADWNWNPPANFRNCRVCEVLYNEIDLKWHACIKSIAKVAGKMIRLFYRSSRYLTADPILYLYKSQVHFDEDQFEYNTSDGSHRRFKPGAIPTLFNVSPSPEEMSGISSFGKYCSRRRKKIVGNYDPSVCASNMNQRNPKENAMTSSLPVTSCLTDHPYFLHSSSQVQYNYHKRFEDNRPQMPLAFHGRAVDAVPLPNIPISTAERFNISSTTSSRAGDIPDTDLSADNIQTILEPGEIKLEYIADSPASENETSSWSPIDKTISVKPLRIQENPEQNKLQEIPQTTVHEQFKNHHSTMQPMLPMIHKDQEQRSQPAPDLSQNIKIDYDFKMSASDAVLSQNYCESNIDRAQLSKSLATSTSALSATTAMPTALKEDLTILSTSSEMNHQERIQRLIPMEKWTNSPKLSMQKDIPCNIIPKSLPDQISSGGQFFTSPNRSHVAMLTKRNRNLFQQKSEHEKSTDADSSHLASSPDSISYSTSSQILQSRKNIQLAIKKKEQPTCVRKRLHDKQLLADRLQKKLQEEKQISRRLRRENQKLKKQLGPLRSLRHWISKFLGTDQVEQLESLEPRKTFESLQKALKMCSLVCGYLSTVVKVPFYSTQT